MRSERVPDRRPTGQTAHAPDGGVLRTTRRGIAPVVLAAALSGTLAPAASPGQTAPAPPAPPPAAAPPALTPTEYNNTVADLFGFPRDGDRWPARPALADRISPRREPSRGVFVAPPPPPVWPWRFPREAGLEGFEGMAEGQQPSSYQVEELHLAAMHFASFALVSPTFFACDGWAARPAAEQEACAWASLERFARRAYRRPLDAGGDTAARGVLAGQRVGRPPRRGGGADGRGRLADADVSLQDRAAPRPGRRCDAAGPLGAGVAPLLLPVGLDARRGAVRGGRGRRPRHPGRRRGPGPADARGSQGAARPRPLPPPVARHRRGAADRPRPAGVRPAVRPRAPARHRARRRRRVARRHGPGAALDEARDRAVRRAHGLRRRRHVHGALDRPPRLHVGRHRPHLRRRGRARRGPRGDPDDRPRGRLHRPAQAADLVSGQLPPRRAGRGADPAVGARPRRLRGAAGAHPARRPGARAARLHAPRRAGAGGGDGPAPPTPSPPRAPTASAPPPPPGRGPATRATGPSTRRGSPSSTTTPSAGGARTTTAGRSTRAAR